MPVLRSLSIYIREDPQKVQMFSNRGEGGNQQEARRLRRAKVACKPSSVFRVERTTTIYLGLSLPTGSSGQPGDGPGRTLSPY